MKHRLKLILLPLFLTSLAAIAKPTSEPISLPYESVFKNYQTHADVPLRDWKASNEAVRKAGGWRQYLKESQATDAANAPAAPAPSAADHSKHTPQTTEAKKP